MRFGFAPRTLVVIVTAVSLMGAAATPDPDETTPPPTPSPPPPPAEILANFDPGDIISDAVFYDSGTMNAADIQAFLEVRNPQCLPGEDGTPCLKHFRVNTKSKAADDYCGAYTGARRESAATVIDKVAKACGINPRVLIVLLQKEQSLITGSGSTLNVTRYMKATGYACPDTAPCNTAYRGFFNQVYTAAHRMNEYVKNSEKFNYRVGMTANIKYHPNMACGDSPVTLANKATAVLYNYTPYQPNAWALAAGTGLGDACSSYGNRNFYNNFTAWFGSTH